MKIPYCAFVELSGYRFRFINNAHAFTCAQLLRSIDIHVMYTLVYSLCKHDMLQHGESIDHFRVKEIF